MKNIFKDFILSKKTLTDRLFDEVSDYDIYCELIGFDINIGTPIKSPIRIDDDVPSFSLFIPTKIENLRMEELWWRDFRDGSGNVFKFVQIFARIHYGVLLEDRKDIITFIDLQLGLGILNKNIDAKKYQRREVDYDKLRESKEILFTSRPYTERDLVWWANQGVDEELLKQYNVRSIRYLLDEDYNITRKISIYDLAFAFVMYNKVKIYMPEAHSSKKWRNSCPAEYIQGWEQLEGYDTLIITKSYKDLLVFKSFMNVDVIAPQGESFNFDLDVIKGLKDRYKKIFVVYDYDAAGIIGAEKLEAQGMIKRWVSTEINPKTEKPDDKDISDYITNHSILEGVRHMQTMFPELNEDEYFRFDRIIYFSNLLKNLTNN
jgi:hypothetical protein